MDTLLEKDTYVAEKIVTTQTNVVTEIVPYNKRRVALLFACVNNSVVSTVPGLLQQGAGGAFPIMGTTGVLAEAVMNRVLHGALAQCAWFSVNSASADTFQVIEVLEA